MLNVQEIMRHKIHHLVKSLSLLQVFMMLMRPIKYIQEESILKNNHLATQNQDKIIINS